MNKIFFGDSLEHYALWDDPTVIVSDGPYGISGYDGDLQNSEDLAQWYEPHINIWSDRSSASTTLWFWNTEIGWAEVHNTLKKYGWIYRSCNVWNKGIEHVSGNTNTKTLRKFPVVTEVCVHYIRQCKFTLNKNGLSAQEWLRSEWQRTGISFCKANEACGVKNAATRKYLTNDHLWYFPPADVFQKLVDYANVYGNSIGKPYFSVDGVSVLSGNQWEKLRGKFYCEAGVTNVWNTPAVRGYERLKLNKKSIHPNQKPIILMNRIIKCSSDVGDVVWEPFGGLCSASIASLCLKRKSFASEINSFIYELAKKRLFNNNFKYED